MAARVDRYWARYLGVDVDVLSRPGVRVVPHAELADYAGIWLFRRGASCIVSAPRGRTADVAARVAGRSVAELGDRDAVAELFPEATALVGPAFHASVAPDCFRPHPDPEARALGPDDDAHVDALRDACTADDWELGAGTALGAPLAGCFREGRLVALAHMRLRSGHACDPGILTDPEWRGRGCGRAAVSVLVEAALAEDRLVLYQTLVANAPAVSLARALGFDPNATHIAVRLAERSAAE